MYVYIVLVLVLVISRGRGFVISGYMKGVVVILVLCKRRVARGVISMKGEGGGEAHRKRFSQSCKAND